MTLCWNPDGSMCTGPELARRIKLSLDGRWKLGVGEVPKGEGTDLYPWLTERGSKPLVYNEEKCRTFYKSWLVRNSNRP